MQQGIKSMDRQIVSMGFEERAEMKGMDSGQGIQETDLGNPERMFPGRKSVRGL